MAQLAEPNPALESAAQAKSSGTGQPETEHTTTPPPAQAIESLPFEKDVAPSPSTAEARDKEAELAEQSKEKRQPAPAKPVAQSSVGETKNSDADGILCCI